MKAFLRTSYVLFLGHLWASLSPAVFCRVRIPPHDQVARVARFVAHQCDWASMATISTHKPVVGQPFSNAFSVSDGPEGSSSGVPYMYLTRMEISVKDLEVTCAVTVYYILTDYFFMLASFYVANIYILGCTVFKVFKCMEDQICQNPQCLYKKNGAKK